MVTVNFLPRTVSLTSKAKQFQTPSEEVVYSLDMTPWGLTITGTPTILKAVDIEAPATDVSATIFPGADSVSESANVITLKKMSALTLGKTYRIHVNFTDGTSTYEANFLVECRY